MTFAACTDAELLRAVAGGDERALRELIDRHQAWLSLRLARRSSDPDLTSAALQNTFVAIWRHASRFRGDGEVGAWIWGIAIRQLATLLRGHSAPAPIEHQRIAQLTPDVASAEDELLVAVENGDVGSAMRRLSPDLRQALQITVLDGLTTREAAQLLGIPHSTLKSRVRLAKERLRRELIGGWA